MIFVEERIRTIDRMIAARAGKGWMEPGVMLTPHVRFSKTLYSKDGRALWSSSYQVRAAELNDRDPEQVAVAAVEHARHAMGVLRAALAMEGY
jgi:hypothetical protein